MEKQIKEQRVKIDGITQLVKGLKPHVEYAYNKTDLIDIYYSKEIDKSIDCLLLAKAWLGKCLEYIATESPYKSGYKTKEDIEKTADVNYASEMLAGYEEHTPHIEKVDYLRTKIEELLKIPLTMDLSIIADGLDVNNFLSNYTILKLSRAKQKSNEYLTEAKFWLRFELQRIKESR